MLDQWTEPELFLRYEGLAVYRGEVEDNLGRGGDHRLGP
jgi:hypothetical protein